MTKPGKVHRDLDAKITTNSIWSFSNKKRKKIIRIFVVQLYKNVFSIKCLPKGCLWMNAHTQVFCNFSKAGISCKGNTCEITPALTHFGTERDLIKYNTHTHIDLIS